MHVPPPPLPVPPLQVPLQPGSKLNCNKYGAPRPVKIISRVVLEDGSFEYFVIYNAHRRNDEWVQPAQLNMDSLMPNVEDVTPEELSRVRTVDFIQLRRYEIKTWYPSPVMSEFNDYIKLHVCECCLAFRSSKTQLKRHKKECQGRDPPGHEIYIDGRLSVFQIDGAENKGYCDNLCHLGSMFLDIGISSETIESSMFYVLVVRNDLGYDLIAYFSEVKQMMEPYGSSRFLCLPPHQRRGYATLLVRLACELKRREDAGALSYYSKFLKWINWRAAKPVPGQSYEDLCRQMKEPTEDNQTTVEELKALEKEQLKFTYHFSLLTDVLQTAETGIELRNTENLDIGVDRCPEFDVARVMWPYHQGRTKVLLLLFLSFSFCLGTFIPRFL